MYIDFKDPTKIGKVQSSSNDEPLLPPVNNTINDNSIQTKEVKKDSLEKIDITESIDLDNILNLNEPHIEQSDATKTEDSNEISIDEINTTNIKEDLSNNKEDKNSLLEEINSITVEDEIPLDLDDNQEKVNKNTKASSLTNEINSIATSNSEVIETKDSVQDSSVSLIDEIKSIKTSNSSDEININSAIKEDLAVEKENKNSLLDEINSITVEDELPLNLDNNQEKIAQPSNENTKVSSLTNEINSIDDNEQDINSKSFVNTSLDPEDNILNKIQKVLQEKQKKNETQNLNLENSSPKNKILNDTPINETIKPPKNPNVNGYAKFEPFELRGKASEFFKIWIVNVALSIITLGIYSAWAKVRNNRYIYANTYLHNSNFEYNANPKKILIGRAIVVLFYALFFISSRYLGLDYLSIALVLIFLTLLPYLIRQAISFNLKSTSYRNIPFKFHAKIRSFYYLALLGILAIAVFPIAMVAVLKFIPQLVFISPIFGLIYYVILFFTILPILYKRYKDLVINNASYGNSRFVFSATNKEAISVFSKISMLTFLVSLVYGGVTYSLKYAKPVLENNPYFHDPIVLTYTIYFIVAIIYLFFTGFFKGISDGYLSNFVRNHTTLDGAEFKGEIKPLKLGFISATNAVMLLLSVGLLYPWTKFRYLKYKMQNSYVKCSNYDKFSSSGYEKTSAIGEETMDFFDIDIGI